MDTLTQFGTTAPRLYRFNPRLQVAISDNFADLRPQSSRAVGLSGALNEYGLGRSPVEAGNVQATFWIRGEDELYDSNEVWQAMRDLRAMADWGVLRLYKQPMAQNEPRMFCFAEVNNIPDAHNVRALPHRRMQVQLNFRVNDPRWYRLGTELPLWDVGERWDSGLTWDGSATARTFTSVFNTGFLFAEANTGNIEAKPRITVIVPDGEDSTGFRLRRIADGRIQDELTYDAPLTSNDIVEIDTQAMSVLHNGAPAYANLTAREPDWFRLTPGVNELNISHFQPANNLHRAQIIIRFNEAFR